MGSAFRFTSRPQPLAKLGRGVPDPEQRPPTAPMQYISKKRFWLVDDGADPLPISVEQFRHLVRSEIRGSAELLRNGGGYDMVWEHVPTLGPTGSRRHAAVFGWC